MSNAGRGFTLSVLGVRLAVVGELAVVVDALDRFVLPWVPRAPIDGEPADRLVEVRRAGDGDGLEIVVDGEVTGRASGPLAAVPVVQRALDDALVQRQKDFAVVHSGVVAHGGGAVLLPGPTGSGKSTLVAELVRRGALYLSDEYALVDGAGDVHPYPRPLLLRGQTGDRAVLATELGGAVARQPMPAALVVAVAHAADAPSHVEPMNQGEGLVLLLRNTPQALADRPWILAPLARAVGRAACYVGHRGEAGEAADAILRLAASVARARPAAEGYSLRAAPSDSG